MASLESQQTPASAVHVPLTASALGELEREVAQTQSQSPANGQDSKSIFTPNLQGRRLLRKASSEFPQSAGTRGNLEAFATETQTLAPGSQSAVAQPQEVKAEVNASSPSMIDQPSYIVDGIVYRSPETVGTLIEVRESEGKGFGVFALKDIPVGTLILSERPLVKLNDDGSRIDPLDTLVNALDPALKRAYRALHGFRPLHRNTETLNRRIMYSNGFAIEKTTTAVFKVASRFNHSCVPNAEFAWDCDKGRMEYFTAFKLLEGEEITIDYGHKKGFLKKYYGFECDCGACTEWGSVSSSSAASEQVVKGEETPRISLVLLNGATTQEVKVDGKENGVGTGEHQKENGKLAGQDV